MIDINTLVYKKLDQKGVDELVLWAKNEGWNPGPEDSTIFYKTDPDGFYGYFNHDELIAGGAIISYNGKYGFMGLFIVKPEYRGLGIGNNLWLKRRDMLISRLDKDAPIGMDGVVDMQPFYKKGGFEIAFKDKRYERIGEVFPVHENISSVENTDFNNIVKYDISCFGVNRQLFLKYWLEQKEVFTFKYIDNNTIKGYAVLRKANIGYKVGPLFADNSTIAEHLYRACLNSVPGENVYLDIPMNNNDAIDLVKKYNAKYVFECARMYYGKPVKTEDKKVFGITSFELG
jgi:ribosomal protein S18 acetylase RimI-like enzyme